MTDIADDRFRLGADDFLLVHLPNDQATLLIIDADGTTTEIHCGNEDDAGGALDRWLSQNRSSLDHGFGGFVAMIWDHEEQWVGRHEFLTPGSVLPDLELDSFIAAREFSGDMVVSVHDAEGVLLVDRSDEVRKALNHHFGSLRAGEMLAAMPAAPALGR